MHDFGFDFDRAFERLFGKGSSFALFLDGEPLCRFAQESTGRPDATVEETDEAYKIHVDLPGVGKEYITVETEKGVLRISGERTNPRNNEEKHEYSREFRLGRNIDTDKIQALYKDGVLLVEVPKKAETKARKIPVSG